MEEQDRERILTVTLRFKSGPETVAVVKGLPKDMASITVGDLMDTVLRVERDVERLLGLRCHVEVDTR